MKCRFAPIYFLSVLAWWAFSLPWTFQFERFLFGDQAWMFATDQLLDEGLMPTVDFAYGYGLLGLLINRIGLSIFGYTPLTFAILMLVANLLMAVGVVRIVDRLQVGIYGKTILLMWIPFCFVPHALPSPVHAIEAALLVLALCEHLHGRRGFALALLVAAIFMKPAIAYFYGLYLVIEVLCDTSKPFRKRISEFMAPMAILLVLSAITIGYFGVQPTIKTLFPISAINVYEEEKMGFFFGAGSAFWKPTPPIVLKFLFEINGLWILSTIGLFMTAIFVWRPWREPQPMLYRTCALLHATFVCLFFANQWSWIYYPTLLFLPIAIAADRATSKWLESDNTRLVSLVVRGLFILAILLAQVRMDLSIALSWLNQQARQPTFSENLADAQGLEEWRETVNQAKTHRTFVLNRVMPLQSLSGDLYGPKSFYLNRSGTEAELEHAKREIESAKYLIVPKWANSNLLEWPNLKELLADFHLNSEKKWFYLFARKSR
jgi:hypothetical protein